MVWCPRAVALVAVLFAASQSSFVAEAAEDLSPAVVVAEGVRHFASSPDGSTFFVTVDLTSTGDTIVIRHGTATDTRLTVGPNRVAVPGVAAPGEYYEVAVLNNMVTLVGPDGLPIRRFALPHSSLAVGATGRLFAASVGRDRLGAVFGPTGAMIGEFGGAVLEPHAVPSARDTLNLGVIAAHPQSGFWYVTSHRPSPVAWRFSDDGKALGSFPLLGSALDRLRPLAEQSVQRAATRAQVGGLVVVTAATVDPLTGNLWVAVPAASDEGVLLRFDDSGRFLGEYRCIGPDGAPLLKVDALAFSGPSLFALSGGTLYRYNRPAVVDQAAGRRQAADVVVRPASAVALLEEGDCPQEQPWNACIKNCPTSVDCKEELTNYVNGEAVFVVGNSCDVSGAGCVASVTVCNKVTKNIVVMSTNLACNNVDDDGDGQSENMGDCNDGDPCVMQGGRPGGTYCDWNCDGGDDDCNGVADQTQCNGSPVVLDMAGDGLHLTDVSVPVWFDIDGDGAREPWSWTASDSNDAWLVLDRNGNGRVDNGLELFGNWTDQAPSDAPNGFLALAQFDSQGQGGNSDGWIDRADRVFGKLQLWFDRNRNGDSDPGELVRVRDSGVQAIGLRYRESRRTDTFGNRLRYAARVNARRPISRWAVDVFLMSGGVEPSGGNVAKASYGQCFRNYSKR